MMTILVAYRITPAAHADAGPDDLEFAVSTAKCKQAFTDHWEEAHMVRTADGDPPFFFCKRFDGRVECAGGFFSEAENARKDARKHTLRVVRQNEDLGFYVLRNEALTMVITLALNRASLIVQSIDPLDDRLVVSVKVCSGLALTRKELEDARNEGSAR